MSCGLLFISVLELRAVTSRWHETNILVLIQFIFLIEVFFSSVPLLDYQMCKDEQIIGFVF